MRVKKHQNANHPYLGEGVTILELVQKAAILYDKQNMAEKRRLIDFVLSNSIWQQGKLIPTYRKPFDMLTVTNLFSQKKKAVNGKIDSLRLIWLPGLVSQSVLLWDGVKLEMKRTVKNHIKINLLQQINDVKEAPLYTSVHE